MIESAVSRKPVDPNKKRKSISISLDPQVTAQLKSVAKVWNISPSKFAQRAIVKLIEDLKTDPSLLRNPEEIEDSE